MSQGIVSNSRRRGFSLVEICVTMAVAAVLATLAVPTYLDQIARSRRVDATTALQRLQFAQERYRQDHGTYAQRLDQLAGAFSGISQGGFYRIELRAAGPDAYDAVAVAEASQARDRDCLTLTLRVQGLISQRQPTSRCWSA